MMNDQPRSHMERRTLLSVGIWYAGSSITNGAGSPENIAVFFSMIPDMMIEAMPMKYADTDISGEPPKIAPAIIAMNGTFAPQGMNVVVMIVIRLSRSFSIVRLAMIPGTPQPTPTSIGMNDFPERPNLRNTRSSTNAIRAIYPQASRKASRKKSTSICGTNPSTAPTPATIPSRISPLSQSAQPILSRPLSTSAGIPGTNAL